MKKLMTAEIKFEKTIFSSVNTELVLSGLKFSKMTEQTVHTKFCSGDIYFLCL